MVVTVAVAAHQPARLEAGEVLGEVGHHVAAVLLAVNQDVDAQLLLLLNPEGGGLLLQRPQLLGGDGAAPAPGARLGEVVRLGEAPHRGDREEREFERQFIQLFAAHWPPFTNVRTCESSLSLA